jgi:tol-pal system protein YbgF
MKSPYSAALQILLALTLISGQANAGMFDDEEARRAILDLRQKIEAVRQDGEQKLADEVRRSSDDSAQWRRSVLDLQNQLESLKAELAKLRGQNEQLARDLSDTQRREKDGLQVLDERIRKLEPLKVTVDGQDFTAEPVEKRDFEGALAIFRKGDFAAAQVAFVDFLNRYSQSGYRPSAFFWLGNAQYATKDFKEALANFRALITLAGEHMRVPEAYLDMANCLLELKDAKAYRKALEDLVAAYPNSEAASAAKDRLSRLK